MSDTGIVRHVDELGRIVIPMEMRRTLGIKAKDPISIYVEGERIILPKHRDACASAAARRRDGHVKNRAGVPTVPRGGQEGLARARDRGRAEVSWLRCARYRRPRGAPTSLRRRGRVA